jgi:hypothetical protein
MGRPRKNPLAKIGLEAPVKEAKSLIDEAKELSRIADKDKEGFSAKEATFCRLIAEGGFSQKQAYIEAFQPSSDVKDRSIVEMSCRIANKPAVKHEIERIQTDLKEEALQRQTKLMFALSSKHATERIAIELYSLGTSATVDAKTKIRSLELLGRMKHIDCFASSTSVLSNNVITGNLGVNTNLPALEAKTDLLNNITKLIESRKSSEETKV